MFASQAGGEHEPSLTALFTFVARDPVTNRAMAINQLVPRSQEDAAAFAERQEVATARKAARGLLQIGGELGVPHIGF